jgi:glycosyltransferase involved in cell wall biosynthesis
MRILFLADAVFIDQPGGAYVVADELARQLVLRDHEVTFLVPRHNTHAPADERNGSIRIVRYAGAGNRAQFINEGRLKAAMLWNEAPFDIVHTHFAYAATGPAKVLPPTVAHVRSFYGPWHEEGLVEDTARVNAASSIGQIKANLQRSVKFNLRKKTEQESLARSAAAIVLSEHSRQEVLDLNYPNEKIHLIPGGVDTERFNLASGGRASARQALGLPQERPILFCVRRLAPRMGLDNLIESIKVVVQKMPDVLLLIGGKGPEGERLQKLITDSNLQSNVQMVGFIADAQLADYYRAADVFVLPTTALEGFGLVTVEALACGTPVIATPIGASPEILGPLDKRLLTKSPAPVDLAEAIQSFLTSSWRHDLTAEKLREFVLSRYTWQRHADSVENIYRQLHA